MQPATLVHLDRHPCHVCNKTFARVNLRSWMSVGPGVGALIEAAAPGWSDGAFICRPDLRRFSAEQAERLLKQERGPLGELDRDVLESIETGGLVSQNPADAAADTPASFGEAMADKVAKFGGSWGFILSFLAVLIVWMGVNTIGLLARPFDPYPFILLNLALSSLAAFQAPIIMMSQRRQDTRDRLQAENDYRVNLKAELEIRQLHEKLDHQLGAQWQKLDELQRMISLQRGQDADSRHD